MERPDKASIAQPARDALAPALRVVLLYILFGIIWFSLVDRLLLLIIHKPSALATWDTLEPWTFVGLTSIVLLLALRLSLRRIQTSEQRWKLLFDAAPDAYYLHDMNGTFLDGNRAAEELTGYHKDEIVGKNLFEFELLVPDDLRKAAELLDQNRRGKPGGPTSYTLKKKDGTFAAIEVRTLPIRLEGQNQVIGIARDVTERRLAEESLRESEARFSAIFHASPIAIGITNFASGQFVEVNDTLLQTFGFQRHEIIGRTALDLGMWSSAEDRAELVDLLRAQRRVQQREARFRRKSGEEGDLLISAELVKVEGKEYIVGMLLDITMRKRLEAQLLQAQKMEAIGQLAGGVAHDFNNILAAQLLQLQLIERRKELDPEILASLQELEHGVRRAASLTRQLLLFSRRQVMQTQRVDADEVIEGLLKMLKRLLGEHIQVTFNPSSKPAWVDADVGMLEQVIVNLCVNARDAMPNGGKLILATQVVSRVPATAPSAAEVKAGPFVCLSVQDTGCGMDEPTLKRIFEPFFTTKEPGKGTGLGLATVHGIANQHKGWIEVQSALGQGTTFNVYFPAKDPLVSMEVEGDKLEITGGTETILVIEDDPALRLMVKKTLTLFGYKVLEAGSCDEALKTWDQQIDLVFADMVMAGGLTGLELAERIRRLQPSVRILISSGYSSDLPSESVELPVGIRFFPKPYTPSALAAAVRASLNTGGTPRSGSPQSASPEGHLTTRLSDTRKKRGV